MSLTKTEPLSSTNASNNFICREATYLTMSLIGMLIKRSSSVGTSTIQPVNAYIKKKQYLKKNLSAKISRKPSSTRLNHRGLD